VQEGSQYRIRRWVKGVHIYLDSASRRVCVDLYRIREARRAKISSEAIMRRTDKRCAAGSILTLSIVGKSKTAHLRYELLYVSAREVELRFAVGASIRVRAADDLQTDVGKAAQIQTDAARSG